MQRHLNTSQTIDNLHAIFCKFQDFLHVYQKKTKGKCQHLTHETQRGKMLASYFCALFYNTNLE